MGGEELSTLDLADARRVVGTVRQDVHLLPGTVRFNLSLGRDVPDETLLQAIELSSAGGLVERLGGLDGVLLDGGQNISQGEAQLLAFARVIVADAPFVVLDEATASVDSITEAAIQAATAELLARKTVLVIAHRLSTISHADKIIVLEQGAILEQGTHHDLLADGGHYAKLYRQQLEYEAKGTSA